MESLEVRGAVIRYDDLGPADGMPVVLVHGHPFNRGMWSGQAEALVAAGCRVLAPDLRGYGASDVVPGVTLLPDFADDIAALLDALKIDRAVVGGLSMGGQIAMEMLRSHPGRVCGLVLADTSPAAETEDGKAFRKSLAERLIAEGMGGYADEVIDRMIAPYHVTERPELAERVLEMMRSTAPEGAAAALRGRAERPDYRETLAGARVPVLIVVGADDTYTPVDGARDTHALTPGSTLVVIERAAHMPNLEQAAAFDAALLDFIADVREAGADGA